jgi:rhodanese-related sulfurtransferase
VARELMARGFRDAHPLLEGFDAWCDAGYPLEDK